jgi:arginase
MNESRVGNRRIDLIGAPFNSAGITDGVARAPRALREAGLVEAVVAVGWAVRDHGDLPFPPVSPARDPASHVIAGEALAALTRSLRRAVGESIDAGDFPLVLGGDCPVLLGCLGGSTTRPARGLLFVDGHEDAWPADQSTTGEAADMELGWLLGRRIAELPTDLRREIPVIAADGVIVLGPRDEAEIRDAGVESIEGLVQIIRPPQLEGNPAAVTDQAVATLDGRGPWWLHVDLDVLSAESLAAIDYQQPGGLTWSVLTDITRRALTSLKAVGWTVTIYNPDLDPDGAAAARIVQYIVHALSGTSVNPG